jgi:hypothetical protein
MTLLNIGRCRTLVACACAVALAPATAAAAPLLPDLVADPPVGGNVPAVYADPQGDRLLLRLDGFVHNRGPGALEIRGSDPSGDGVMQTVRQRVYDDGGGPFTDIAHVPAPSLIYETNDDHEHWHLRHAMRYSLWSADRSAQVGPVQKVGFCLLDSRRVEADPAAAPVYTEDSDDFCRSGAPGAASVTMGVSAGWRDVYSYVLAFQWVDVSDVSPGNYWLRADADPDAVIEEADEVNPGAYSELESTVNGYVAEPVDAGGVLPVVSSPIALRATTYDDILLGTPGPREFQIVTPPAGGTLDVPTGTWFRRSSVNYTPNAGFGGPDTFTVAARDASSPFPRNPRTAAVTLGVGTLITDFWPVDGPLGISGAPRSVYTSSTTQLRADGPGVERGVIWSIDGVDGGSPAAGTISAAGLYRAPASAPPAGSVLIGARSATGSSGQVSIAVTQAPRPRAAPAVKAPPVPKRGLSQIRLGRHNRSLIAVVSSAQSGRVRFTVRRSGRRIGFCSMLVRARGSATCMTRLPSTIARAALVCRIPRTVDLKLPGVTVTATLTRGGRVVATRRASAR